MKRTSFAIQFQYETQSKQKKVTHKRKQVYQANITTLSKAFNLFEVTGITRITPDEVTSIPGAYYITSYPLSYAGKETWKDAVTTKADNFLQAIGHAIETYLTAPEQGVYSCLN